MLTGSEEIRIDYSPVEAYGVSTYADSIASGGTGGDATLTKGVRFIWAYYPETPDSKPSGFTGDGWHQDVEGSPIWYSANNFGITLENILAGFEGGTRTNLNDVFQNWQVYVDEEAEKDHDVVQDFQYTVARGCWSNIN